MPKKTKLGDNAEIYQQRKEQSEREKLREMSFKKVLAYLWEYYRYFALAAVIAAAILIYIIVDIVTADVKTVLYAAVINNPLNVTVLDELKEDFAEHLKLDPKHEKIELNPQFYFNSDNEYVMNMKQVLATYVVAQEIDIIIAPLSEFTAYSYYGFMAPLSDQLPTDIYSSLTNRFYIATQEDDPEENVYGIYLTDTDLIQASGRNTEADPYILGIVANSKHKENTFEFIRYLFK